MKNYKTVLSGFVTCFSIHARAVVRTVLKVSSLVYLTNYRQPISAATTQQV